MTIKAILELTASRHGVTVDDIKSKSRKPKYSQARFEVYARLRDLGLSYPRIGQIVGRRHHSTVMAGVKRFRESNGDVEVFQVDFRKPDAVDQVKRHIEYLKSKQKEMESDNA